MKHGFSMSFFIGLLCCGQTLFAQIQAPDQVAAGSDVSIQLSGEQAKADQVQIFDADSPNSYSYEYTRGKTTVALRAPDYPGTFAIRALLKGEVLGQTKTLTVTPVSVTLTAPAEAVAGSAITVKHNGPKTKGDFITIVSPDAGEGEYDHYQYVRQADQVTIKAPGTAGLYEIRYLSGKKYLTWGKTSIKVENPNVSVSAPQSAVAGAEVQINWEGPNNQGDFITVVPVGTPDGEYANYVYTSRGNPAALRLPDAPGSYEIRYASGSGYLTWASTPIEITGADVSLEAPASAQGGAYIEVTWTGPNNQGDYLTVVKQGTEEGEYGNYVYTSAGNPGKLRLPEEDGAFEIRYATGQSNKTLARIPIQLGAITASIEAPAEALAGSALQVGWQGPQNQGDYITIVSVGTKDGEYGNYTYVNKGNPLTLQTPDEPGAYEIRYNGGQGNNTYARHTIRLKPLSASLNAPAEAVAGSYFDVAWDGPDNPGDYITIVKADAEERTWSGFTYVNQGNPVKMRAPKEPGRYQLRYATGQSYRTLARADIAVVPNQTEGTLKVLAATSGHLELGEQAGVELILDASGSMLKRLGEKRRIEHAKTALTYLVNEVLPPGVPFALRVFGHKEADSCRTDLEIAKQALNPSAAAAAIEQVNAMNLAKTPIADSLAKVRSDMAGTLSDLTVVLVTDGEETCGGDPEKAIRDLAAAGVDVRVNIVGFAVGDEKLKSDFAAWAAAGNGLFFDAPDGEELGNRLKEALAPTFTLKGGDGKVIARGTVNGETVMLKPGTYTLEVRGQSETREVTIEPGKETAIRL